MKRIHDSLGLLALGSFVLGGVPVLAGAHTWDVFEIFSNADGTIQFVELREMNGTDGETGVGGGTLTSNANVFDIPNNVASPTGFRHILFGTAGFAALFATLPGAPAPDFIIPDQFFSVNGDTLRYTPYDMISFGAGQLPTDGSLSLNRSGLTLVTGTNSPENYAGQTGAIDASPPPPAVPDGRAGTTPMTVAKLDPSGSALSIAWDSTSCAGATTHAILYGEGTQLPAAPGGVFALAGSVCGVGASPFTWDPTPSVVDASGLLWWLIVVVDGSGSEGSWGQDGAGAERVGPGSGSSSGQCGVTTKDTSNTCGH